MEKMMKVDVDEDCTIGELSKIIINYSKKNMKNIQYNIIPCF
jgi:hypothetical protein